jgi:zinc protease
MFQHTKRSVLLVPVLLGLLLPISLRGQAGGQMQTQAPAAPSTTPALTERLPFDAAVTTGTLPNGLRYYIRRNDKPEQRVALRLAVKAGSIDEADDQQGLAHFLEHMAFNGSRRFKAGELIAALESAGSRLGPHVNAYTAFDETVYMFQLPTDKPEVVLKGVQALADFAGGLTLDPKEVDKERGVVVEEWRGRLGAGTRMLEQQLPVLFYKSRYAERLPIGKPEILKSAPPARLRAFYTQWYRPDRMAVVAVGDIDPPQMLETVRAEFGALTNPAKPVPPRNQDVPLHAELLVKVTTDPETPQSSVQIMRKRKAEPDDRVGDYRRWLVHRLVSQIMNERFAELARKPDAAFLSAGGGSGPLTPTVDTFTLSASVQEGRIEAGLQALALEAKRVKEFGFGAEELERAKKSMLASYDRAYAERDKTESASYAGEYVSHFLVAEPSPGIAYEHMLARAFVPAITQADVTGAARMLLADAGRVVIAIAPQKENVKIPTEEELRAALTRTESVAVTAWNDAASGRVLLERIPDPGVVKDRREIPELGVTVVRFDNGVEAWLKPTDFKNDQVLFALAAPGGLSLAGEPVFIEASLAAPFTNFSGAGQHTMIDLQKLLAGQIASASPFASLTAHGVSGSASPANLETAMQLLYMRVTAPANDPNAFELMKKQITASLANRDRNPPELFREKVSEVNTGGHYTAKTPTVERIGKLDRDAMLTFYRERFASAADFTFFMVGNFRVDEVLPLVGRYVGSLPSKGQAASSIRDIGIAFPQSTERATVEKGKEPRSQTVLSFFADPPIDENEGTRISAAAEVLEFALRDILREELGETYSVNVSISQQQPMRGTGHVRIGFGGAPDNAEKMAERILQEVRRLQQEGPSEDLTNRAKETARREHETEVKTNSYWLSRLQSAKLLDRDPMLLLTRRQRIDAITRENLHEMFKKYFPLDRYTVVRLMPEKTQ